MAMHLSASCSTRVRRSTYCVEVNDLHDEVSSTSDNDGEARRVPGPLKERHRLMRVQVEPDSGGASGECQFFGEPQFLGCSHSMSGKSILEVG